jgi:dTDP-4-amino-4,6-dideoxygalactose transaminase
MKADARLAIDGGPPVRRRPFPPHPVLGAAERRAVQAVLASGKLSTFVASPGEHFLGGRWIREFERRMARLHGVPHAVAMNSATSCLHAAVAACGVEPGQEVIVPPTTFTSTATSVLMHNAVPVFADVSPRDYCIRPDAIERAVTRRTRAIIVVHLFGMPADLGPILALARRRGLKLIEDCAQAPGARYRGRRVGTLGDCGVFSFQESKHIATGEGGMLLTRDPEIARRAQMVRNHGEMILPTDVRRSYTTHILGWGYRMTELEAALGAVQVSRLERNVRERRRLAEHLTRRLEGLPGIRPPREEPGRRSAYYAYAFGYDASAAGLSRERFVQAVNAEGIPLAAGST